VGCDIPGRHLLPSLDGEDLNAQSYNGTPDSECVMNVPKGATGANRNTSLISAPT
jgi:hypothetical protein